MNGAPTPRGFDHRDDGVAERRWADGPLRHLGALPAPGPGDRLLVLAAHPDDETLGAGGLIAAAARRGAAVSVVVASDGEASHPHSPTHTPAELAALRRREVQEALRDLAPGAALHFLGLADGRLRAHHAALAAQLRHFARDATHLVTPWAGDRHPDHEACAAVAAELAAEQALVHWQYPIWVWHWGDPDGSGADALPWRAMRSLPLGADELAAKRRALARHASQTRALSAAPGDEAILSAGMLAHFERPYEVFVIDGASDASSPRYFEVRYQRSDDPWGLADRFYERRKRALTLAALPRPRFRRAFEPGCSIGLLTERLAERCEQVVAWDVAGRAVEQARQRTAGRPGVRVGAGRIPAQWPDGEFDLVVLSEVGYYCRDLDALVGRVLGSLAADGVVLACHWRHPAPEHPQTAEAVHEALGRELAPVVAHSEQDFLLHVWSRTGRSVAADAGILT